MAWVAEETFESYSNGNSISTLNGGTGFASGWSLGGGTLTITNSVAYDGSLSATATSAGLGGNNAIRQFSSDVSGAFVFYVALRRSSNSSGEARWNFRNTSNSDRLSVVMKADGKIYIRGVTGGANNTEVGTYSADTPHVIRVTGNTSTGSATAAISTDAYGTAGTFGTESSTVSFSTGDLRYVLIDFGDSAGTGVTSYWDYLSPTSPFSAPAAGSVPRLMMMGMGR